ncbi:class I SAM-dependent methyltransferase [Halobellus limi]|uniref:Class I SAM-dependent methyltransferase n=1 Tax=Halobellus limi TaxID=699433 RepID=A0A1H5YLU7_9EURY|nr:class I SAM-dependent methyltransferase [Halobellus limi]QCC48403.1 class I SAM-dependent methyltransferase [Halobellus limi]SEG25048.1 Methyltransferase domain-containing protein [Halobellus limi]
MRKFSPEYLRRTREGMWEESREALDPLSLSDRSRILDAGAGTGELARVLDEESPGDVVCLDADADLPAVARGETGLDAVVGDATRPPFADDSFDLVVCQALLVNLPDPGAALRAFGRLSTELVAAIEPDNADVGVDSTVEREVELERRVRAAYIEGVETDVAMGDRLVSLFRESGFESVRTRRYYHRKVTEPPYGEEALSAAARKASGGALAEHEAELRRTLSAEEYDALRGAWREMGRDVIDAMREETYRRAEVVPFDVVVGRVGGDGG